MRLKYIVMTVLLIPTIAFAHLVTPLSGFYFGLQGGMSFAQAKNRQIIPFTNGFEDNILGSLTSDSGIGSVFIGYSGNVGRFYISGELVGAIQKIAMIEQDIFPDSISSAIRVGNYYGITIHPGVLINSNSLLYALTGIVITRISTREQPDDPNFIVLHDNRVGYQFGLGFAYYVANHLALRIQYAYTLYSYFSGTVIMSTGLPMNFRHIIRSNEMMMGLSLIFK